MVGDAGGPVRSVYELRNAYDAAARLWADGSEPVYASLARALVGQVGLDVAGGRVLDLGAGTGVAGRAALAAGARSVVCADSALGMLRGCGAGLDPVAADATALPFGDGRFDLVLAAFCLGHLDRPVAGLREARRVGAALAASSFAAGWNHPAKAAVDEVLGAFGYRPPPWYLRFKRDTEPRASDPFLVGRDVAAAGYTDVRLRTIAVDTGLSRPAELAAWRLGMAHVAPFVVSLPADRRAALRRAASAAVTGTGPLVVSMLVLIAR
ncbi:MAG TPA: class I SAM-dependent methyltransferase [Streptosporangiaceae bacterium]|nr:class I SAM-dependent methyltransferase [Streptosporangiaceae bacterium]